MIEKSIAETSGLRKPSTPKQRPPQLEILVTSPSTRPRLTADSEDDLVGYTDSGYAGLIDGQKSAGGYILVLSGGPLSHQSKLQSTVALSSTEAEYMATTEAGKEPLRAARFLACLVFRLPSQPVDLCADSKVAILLIENRMVVGIHWKDMEDHENWWNFWSQ